MARLTGLEPATSGVTGRHSNQLSYNRASVVYPTRAGVAAVARLTGLEPATSGVTGRHSNHLSYNRSLPARAMPERDGRSMAARASRQASKPCFRNLVFGGGRFPCKDPRQGPCESGKYAPCDGARNQRDHAF